MTAASHETSSQRENRDAQTAPAAGLVAPRQSMLRLGLAPETGLIVAVSREFIRMSRANLTEQIRPPGGVGSTATEVFIEEGRLREELRRTRELAGEDPDLVKPVTAVCWDPRVRPGDLTSKQLEKAQALNKVDLPLRIVAPDMEELEGVDLQAYTYKFISGYMWPLLHDLTDRIEMADASDFRVLRQVGAQFAAKIKETYSPGDVIWIHDYQLAQLPGALREHEAMSNATIGYFHHVPFPTWETLERWMPQPHRTLFIRNLLGSDLIGFQTGGDLEKFVDCCRKLGYQSDSSNTRIFSDGQVTQLGVYPMSVNFEKLRHPFEDKEQQEQLAIVTKLLKDQFRGKTLLLSLSSLDYIKGVWELLNAYQALLETPDPAQAGERLEVEAGDFSESAPRAKYADKLVLFLVVAVANETTPEYQLYLKRIRENVHYINRTFGSTSGQPIVYREEPLSHDHVLRWLRAADVLVVPSIRDGQNLTIKEALTVADAEAPWPTVFVLGKGAGASHELRDLVLVDGASPASIAGGISRALEMRANSPERAREIIRSAQQYLKTHDVWKWARDQMVELTKTRNARAHDFAYEDMAKAFGIVTAEDLEEEQTARICLHSAKLGAAHDFGLGLARLPAVNWMFGLDGRLGRLFTDRAAGDGLFPAFSAILRAGRSDTLSLVGARAPDEIRPKLQGWTGLPVVLCSGNGEELFDFAAGRPIESIKFPDAEEVGSLEAAVTHFVNSREKPLSSKIRVSRREKAVSILMVNGLSAEKAAEKIVCLVKEFHHANKVPRDQWIIRPVPWGCEIVPRWCNREEAVKSLMLHAGINGKATPVYFGDHPYDGDAFGLVDRAEGQTVAVGARISSLRPFSRSFESPELVAEAVNAYLERILDRE